MTKLNLSLLTTAAVMAAAVAPAHAEIEYPWCAQYSDEDGGGGRNCGFVSWEQCMETVRGMGGSCEPNLFYKGPAERAKKPVTKRKNERG